MRAPPGDKADSDERSSYGSRAGSVGSHRERHFLGLRLARLIAFASIAAIAGLSLAPGGLRPPTELPGRAEHFIAYAGAGFFLALSYFGWRQRLVTWSMLALASGVFEMLQNFIPGRSPSLLDAVASSGGLSLGIILGVVLTAVLTGWGRRADEPPARR